MFPYTDPQSRLDLYHQHTEQLRREVAANRLARCTPEAGRHRWFGRRARPGRSPIAP
ncbi:MAG: hypothetical protein ACJ786_30570 [Catenulispora sp.]